MTHVIDGNALADELHARLADELDCLYVSEQLPADAELAEALATLGKLNADPRITGILVLRPLPSQVPEVELYRLLDPAKDIDVGINPVRVAGTGKILLVGDLEFESVAAVAEAIFAGARGGRPDRGHLARAQHGPSGGHGRARRAPPALRDGSLRSLEPEGRRGP